MCRKFNSTLQPDNSILDRYRGVLNLSSDGESLLIYTFKPKQILVRAREDDGLFGDDSLSEMTFDQDVLSDSMINIEKTKLEGKAEGEGNQEYI